MTETAKLIEKARRNAENCDWAADPKTVLDLCDALERSEQARIEGRLAGLEEAAKAMCKMCAEGKLEVGPCRKHWHHYWGTDEGIAGVPGVKKYRHR